MSEARDLRGTGGEQSPAPTDVSDITVPLLRSAVRRLAARLEGDPESLGELQVISRCVDPGAMRPFFDLEEFDSKVCLELVRRLRHEALHSASESEVGTAHELVTLASAFDRVDMWLESRLRRAEEPLPHLNVAVEIAHDLRSPLTSVLFLSQTLRNGGSGEVNELQHRQLGLIYAAAFGVVSLATNLIELASADNELLEPQPAPFSITGMLESICDMARPLAEEKNLELKVVLPAYDCRVGFAAALSRVILNLLNNALQHTERGYVEIAVAAEGVSELAFSVRDTGSGMSDEVQARLFEPFRRPRHDRGPGFSGSGLGLAICRRLLRAMGAELNYETEPNVGTRFYFRLLLPPAIV
jgi:signal transduction histidine kinase